MSMCSHVLHTDKRGCAALLWCPNRPGARMAAPDPADNFAPRPKRRGRPSRVDAFLNTVDAPDVPRVGAPEVHARDAAPVAIVERKADDVALGDLSTPWEFRTRGGLAVQGQWAPYLDRELVLVRATKGARMPTRWRSARNASAPR